MKDSNACVIKAGDGAFIKSSSSEESGYVLIKNWLEATSFPHYGAAKKYLDKLRVRGVEGLSVVPKSSLI